MTATTASRRERVVAELLVQPWVVDLYKELTARQPTSTGRWAELQALLGSSAAAWPFHAPPLPPCIAEAQGARIRDVDGNSYVDFHLGWGAQALHGHNPPAVVQAVADALSKSPGNGYFHELEVEHARFLRQLLPHCEKFAFFHSGSDATYAAIRLARAYSGRRLVAKVEGAIHGMHDFAAHNTAFWYHGHPDTPFPANGAEGVQPTPAYLGVPPAASGDLLVLPHASEDAFALVERHRHELACVIAEPVASAFPFEEQSIAFVRGLSETCRRVRVPFILDEVLTGFRSGIGGMASRHAIEADLVTYGKVLSALGLPLSAVGGRGDLLDLARTTGVGSVDIGSKTCVSTSHFGNHLALVASHASLQLLRDQGESYYERTRAEVKWLKDGIVALRHETGFPLELVGFGDFIGCLAFLSPDHPSNVREMASAIDPVGMLLLTLLLRRRGVFTYGMPMIFTGGAHSHADIACLLEAVSDSVRELLRCNYPLANSASDA